MRNEIGSFYESTNSQKKIQEETVVDWIKKASQMEKIKLVCSGREALEAALWDIRNKGKEGNKTCIVPQYTCDTVIIPFQKLGWRVFYYPVNRKLQVEEASFRQLLLEVKPSVLLMHTYYGVDTICNVWEMLQEYRRHSGMIFIEDMTQSLALLSEKNGADYYVGSLRKWFSIPDGGFLVSPENLEVNLEKEKKIFVEKKLLAQRSKAEYLQGSQKAKKKEFLCWNREAEDYLYENDSICELSTFSKEELKKIDFKEMFHRRNENAIFLQRSLRGLSKINMIINVTKESPLYFPIYIENREKLQTFLRERDIFAPVLWPIPEQIKATMGKEVLYIFEHLLALPCDQRYSLGDMKRISESLWEYERNGR